MSFLKLYGHKKRFQKNCDDGVGKQGQHPDGNITPLQSKEIGDPVHRHKKTTPPDRNTVFFPVDLKTEFFIASIKHE